jgi:hypothetical protein
MANRFLLVHRDSDTKIEYNIGANPSFTALSYSHGADPPADFKPADIATTTTPLGELVSAALKKTVDTGGELFGFFLPDIEVASGQTAEFTTTGIYAEFSGPDSFPHRPESWRAVRLHGTAESVLQPL